MDNETGTSPPEAAQNATNDQIGPPPGSFARDGSTVTNISIPGYRILRRLGQGGTAAVYLAIQESFGREVGLKIMSPMLNADPTFTMRFVREARIVAQMHHASIVPVFDVGEHHPYHYLSMEYLPGGDLRQRIVEGRVSPALALDVCMAVSSALELAHRKGFVHRDIKPQNILFREDGAPVLTDFGIARAVDVGTSLTVAGMLVGTPAYMSPEQVKGLELDARTDLYSLGMVFYEMLTGNVPFRTDSDSTLSIAMKHLSDTLPPLPTEYAHFQAVIDRLTARERDHRFSSATEVIRALRELNPGLSSRAQTFIGTRQRRTDSTTEAMPLGERDWTAPRPPPSESPSPPPSPSPAPVLKPAAFVSAAAAKRQAMIPWLAGAAVAIIGLAIAIALNQRSNGDEPQSKPLTAAVERTPSANEQTPAATEPPAVGASEPAATQPPSSASSTQPQAAGAETHGRTIAAVTPAPPVNSAQMRAEEERRQREQAAQAERARRIASHLASASDDYARGALVSPASENAADRYRAVLKIDPGNLEAQSGLQRIADRLIADAERARAEDDIDQALQLVEQARSVQPNDPRLTRLELDLRERQPGAAQRRQARMQKAGQHIAKAEQLLARTPMVVDYAADADKHYASALQLTPRAPKLPELKTRIVAAYVASAEYEINRNQPKRAINVVNYARRRGVSTPRLDEIERIALASSR